MTLAAAPNTLQRARSRPAFVYRHLVSFEETNVVGNVYFTRHVAWQGRCREAFLKQHAPDILHMIARDLRLVTIRVACDYYQEIYAFDEIEVQMSLAFLRQHRIGLDFDIMAERSGRMIQAAHGFQEIGCMRATDKALLPITPPASLVAALKHYGAGSFDGGATEADNQGATVRVAAPERELPK